jgi:hypothetical protein
VPGLLRGGYRSSHYQDAPQGADEATYPSDSTYGRVYPQLEAPVPPWPEPRLVGYGTYQASKQPPLGRSSRSEYVPISPVPAANESNPRYPLGIAHQQSSGAMGPADEQDALEGSYLQVYNISICTFVSQSLTKDNRTGRMMVASASTSGSFTCMALSLICCLVAFLTHHFTTVASVQESV